MNEKASESSSEDIGPEIDSEIDYLLEKHREEFEDIFQNNMEEEVPKHPYKVYREIVESRDLSKEKRIALERLKDEYSERWQELKQTQAGVNATEERSFDSYSSTNYNSDHIQLDFELKKTLVYISSSIGILFFSALFNSINIALISLGALIGSSAHALDVKRRLNDV